MSGFNKNGNTPPNKGKGKCIAWLREHVGYTGDSCLRWPYSRDRDGYGQFGLNGKMRKPHRWMCEATHGPAPSPDHHAAHECGNGHGGCVNPRHIVWKTPTDNARDRLKHGTVRDDKGRPLRKLTHEQVTEILRLKGQKSHVELGRMFGVSDSQIRKIHRGVSWRGGMPQKTQGRGIDYALVQGRR